MHHRFFPSLCLLSALAVSALCSARAAERAPALASLTYSGDQSALEALDREIVAAGKDTAKLTALRGSLLAVLRHRDATFAARQAAAHRLGPVLAALPPAERAADYRPLANMLEDPRDCELARLALESAPGSAVDQMFISALEKASGAHRISLMNALGSRRTASAVPALARLAKLEDSATAIAAVGALGAIGGSAADAAIKSATGVTPATRAAARLIAAPGLPRDAALGALREIEGETSLPAAVRLAAFRQMADRDPAASLARLKEALQGSDWPRKEVALEAISSAPSPDRMSLLASGLTGWDTPTQVAAIGVLARAGAATAVPAISSSARSSNREIREASLDALGLLPGSPEIVALLLGAAQGTEDAAKAARRSLARLKGPGVSETILATAEKGDRALRSSALEAIAARNLTEGIPLLLRTRGETDVAVRSAALAALADIGPYSIQSEVISWAVAATDDTERTRALRAVVAITQRGPDSATRAQPLFTAIEKAKPEAAERLLGTLPRLGGEASAACAARLAARPEEKLSAAAVATLARWSDASALPALAALANNAGTPASREAARAAAVQTLDKARDAWTPARSEALRQLLQASKDDASRKNLVALLARANDETAASLAAGLASEAALAEDARYATGAIAANRRGAPKVRANPASGAGNTVDGKTSSRWTVPALGEEWLELDYHVSRPFRRVTLDQTARAADFPERYSVHVTDDPARPGPALAQGAGQRNRTVIELPTGVAGRYLIIRNLAERKDSSWSVCEVYLD